MRPSIRFRIDFGPGRAIGPGKIALLERIERDGSLSEAARNLNMSYRRAWDLLENLNSIFSDPVAVTAMGGRSFGGTKLTPLGRQVIQLYRKFDAQLQARAAHHFGPFKANVPKKARAANRAPVVRLSDR